ncbi:AAA family ATPase [Candidatus Saccharibacteria bacterium]|nr:AAA family ATPase [Candidatus Saccharibacteria bacterium]
MSSEMMFNDINTLFGSVKSILSRQKKPILIYAFNGTGKTRLTNLFYNMNLQDGESSLVCLIYSALFEDAFQWDNIVNELHFMVQDEWLRRLFEDEDLESRIKEIYGRYHFSHFEPFFDVENQLVYFQMATGDDESNDHIKISRAEESLFIWSVYHAVLDLMVDILSDKTENRTTDMFNNVKYIVIDDPVSSIDDTRIVSLAIDLVDTVNKLKELGLKVIILTHHALFFNVVKNIMGDKATSWSLSSSYEGICRKDIKDSPFAYHLFAMTLIKQAIENNTIERYHFNLFRAILEKTANFLGYKHYKSLLTGENKDETYRILNIYSHSRIADMEPQDIPSDHKNLFADIFNDFLKSYNWKIED